MTATVLPAVAPGVADEVPAAAKPFCTRSQPSDVAPGARASLLDQRDIYLERLSGVANIATGFLGGMAGSTAGGMKMIRVLLVMKHAWLEIRKQLHPRAVFVPKVARRAIPSAPGASDVALSTSVRTDVTSAGPCHSSSVGVTRASIVSAAFSGMSMLARHRLVMAALAELAAEVARGVLLPAGLHDPVERQADGELKFAWQRDWFDMPSTAHTFMEILAAKKAPERLLERMKVTGHDVPGHYHLEDLPSTVWPPPVARGDYVTQDPAPGATS